MEKVVGGLEGALDGTKAEVELFLLLVPFLR